MTAREVVFPHFPELSLHQQEQLDVIARTVWDWNQHINVISRKDPLVMERHVLHSLGIAKVLRFQPGSRILDVGTGGGFPGLPLAVLHPDSEFVLCDSIGKKIKVVKAVAKAAGISNVKGVHGRAEEMTGTYDFVVSRAVTRMGGFLRWIEGKINPDQRHPLQYGVLYLKGGDLREELAEVDVPCSVTPLKTWFQDSFFDTKHVVHVDLTSSQD
ncbi:MAG: 16S rRNA (guanine(527)-N(7))-methyltransferase RsmG [Bacteroidota bacterium]|nr:16S rRNA (guanine(527)-N(7))-methyltransferase RsmG [Bacteroidota bacterium]